MPRRESTPQSPLRRKRRLLVAGCVAAAVIVGVAGWWFSSLLPETYSMTSMGYPDFGGGPVGPHGHDAPEGEVAVSVEALVADPDRIAEVRVELVAREGPVTLADGRIVPGFSVNGTSPGPTITATQGQLVEVRVRNENVTDGMTLHWHGVDVSNAADGVAGVTQDAIGVGSEFVYRFVPDEAGTYWYHSHQMSHPQVLGGLLGALVVLPKGGLAEEADVTALVHFYGGVRTINGAAGETRIAATPGTRMRVRIINTDGGPMPVWLPEATYHLVGVDGKDVHRPGPVSGEGVLVTAGARADLAITVPDVGAVRIAMAGASLIVGDGEAPTGPAPTSFVDLLRYGVPEPIGFDTTRPARHFEYAIGRRFGLLDGVPGLWWTINGHQYPDVPMFMVSDGDVVAFRVSNTSGQVHPMHLHGHHALVVARNGEPATGSPWWTDSLNVENGETYDIVLKADNPGIWMDHCHNLPHAREGLMTHLAYVGYATPFLVGDRHRNHPE